MTFAVGQRWEYSTRDRDLGSTLVIGRIDEDDHLGAILHISIFGVSVRNPGAPLGVTSEIGHLPIARDSLEQSVTKLVGSGTVSAHFEEGYRTWDESRGGAFTVSVSEMVEFVEIALRGPVERDEGTEHP
jgi:hypothetical protein